MEAFAALGNAPEQRRRLEPGALPLLPLFQPPHHLRRTHRVDRPERPTPERGEAEPEDGTDVAVARAPEDALLEATDGLVEAEAHRTLAQLVLGERNARGAAGKGRIDGRVHRLALHVVAVKALLRLPAQAPLLDQGGHRARGRHPLAKGVVEDVAHLLADVDADLVQELE